MFLLLYNFFWSFLYSALKVCGRFLPKKWGVDERISLPTNRNTHQNNFKKSCIWFHCASLGEAKGLIGFLANQSFSPLELVITTTTLVGKNFLLKHRGHLISESAHISLAPLDHMGCLRHFIHNQKIVKTVLWEVELWPNVFRVCDENSIPMYWMAARFSSRADKWYSLLNVVVRKKMDRLKWIQTQSDGDRLRLQVKTSAPIETGADYKFIYNRLPNEKGADRISDPAKMDRNGFSFVSLHWRELLKVVSVLPQLQKQGPVYILPRKISEVQKFYSVLVSLNFQKHSENNEGSFLLVDSMGLVPYYLTRSRACFVGGSLVDRGGHNFWEPLVMKVFTFFGPYYYNQESAGKILLREKLGKQITSPNELLDKPDAENNWEKVLQEYQSKTVNAQLLALEKLRT